MGKITDALTKKLKDGFDGLTAGGESPPHNILHSFLNKRSALRSTHFIVTCPLFNPWQVEDFVLSLPQVEFESVGYMENIYTFPVIKNSDPVKLVLTIADDESGGIYDTLFTTKNNTFSNGRYSAPDNIKNIWMSIDIYKPDGSTKILNLNFDNMFITNIDDIKYSYGSLNDYQKYNVTFICDPVNFEYTKT